MTQSEAKGPYEVTQEARSQFDYQVIDTRDGSVVDETNFDEVAAESRDRLNKAHHHALAAQAERVRQLEEACQVAINLLEPVSEGVFALACRNTLREALTPPAKGET